jgi:nuclear cap-binding protein subunit 2
MAELYDILKPENTYYDRKNYDSPLSYQQALAASSTVYVGNLSFFTSQDTIRELFSLSGRVVEIIMGINDEGTACGFCFVM